EADAELMFDDSSDAKTGRAESVGAAGVQPQQIIREYVRAGNIIAADPIGPEQIQPASTELLRKVEAMDAYHIDLSHGAVLETGKVYVIPLQESLALPQHVRGFANPKSTTGRLDVLTRLITDNGTVFDQIEPGYKGRLYLEVAPQTFSVVVR